MRILHVNKFLYRRGGAETYMLDVAELQSRRGHTVDFWAMAHPNNVRPHALEETFAPHVELEPPPRGRAALGAAARMVWSRSSRAGFARALARFRPDVVHCHNIYHQLSPSILVAARNAGTPVVMTLHDYKLVCPTYQLIDHGSLCEACVGHSTVHAIARRCKGGSLSSSSLLALESGIHRLTGAYNTVDVFISPSQFLADVMVRGGIAPARLRVVPHFVEPRGAVQARGHGQGVVFAGRLSPEKGVDTLVRAAATLMDVPVHIAGDGPERSRLEALARDVGANNVVFHGRLAKPELQALVADSIATLVPSRWHENQPMTILESYAAGVPVVVSALGGMPELVRNGTDGLVVSPERPEELAAAVRRLVDDPAAARAMGLAGQAQLRRRHDPALHLDTLEQAYAFAGVGSTSSETGR